MNATLRRYQPFTKVTGKYIAIMQQRSDEARQSLPSSYNEGYNICQDAYSGCQGAIDSEIFYSMCLDNHQNCGRRKQNGSS